MSAALLDHVDPLVVFLLGVAIFTAGLSVALSHKRPVAKLGAIVLMLSGAVLGAWGLLVVMIAGAF